MKTFLLISVGVLLLGSTACTKNAADRLSDDESRIYITNYDEAVSFSSYSTFSIPDSVAVIDNNQFAGRERSAFDAQLIAAFVTQMEQRGYTRVAANANPDLGIAINRVYNDYSGLINYGDYWNYYGGYWDPYYWGYPGYSYYYPSFYGVYTITDGAIQADMVDLKNAATTNQLKVIWDGMIRGTGTFYQSKVDQNVAALFAQSAYLKKN